MTPGNNTDDVSKVVHQKMFLKTKKLSDFLLSKEGIGATSIFCLSLGFLQVSMGGSIAFSLWSQGR